MTEPCAVTRGPGRCIAMWSGPRNISTAMMRAWENRPDTRVVDEPFYAHYLAHTGIGHPMAAEIIADGEPDWRSVVDTITARPAHGIFYQKHITTHMMPHIDLGFLAALSHVFLIRDPQAVVASYSRKREMVTAADLGYEPQWRLFDYVRKLQGEVPPVVDSALFLQDPRSQLEALCARLGIEFDAAMLQWPAGERDSDGIWHRHWYDAVKRSTGFNRSADAQSVGTGAESRTSGDLQKPGASEKPFGTVLPAAEADIVEACMPAYEALIPFAIQTV